jgi:hypothetical protein
METMRQGLLQDINNEMPNNVDLFICSASYEDRCLQIALNLAINITKVLIFKNKAEKNEVNGELKIKNANAIRDHFPSSNVNIVTISKSDPFITSDEMFRVLIECKKTKEQITLIVDITTFTHESLLILFKIINIVSDEKDKIIYVYNPAEEYCYQTNDINKKWLSKGIKEIRTILGYPGFFSPYKKLHLIILVGYEVERCLKLIEEYEPSLVSFGIPKEKDSANKKIHYLNFHRYQRLLAAYPFVNEFRFSSIDPDKTYKDLKRLISKNNGFNTVIAPMNSKLSTLGAGIVGEEYSKVQICYPRANIYNTKDYSLKSNRFIIYSRTLIIQKSELKSEHA